MHLWSLRLGIHGPHFHTNTRCFIKRTTLFFHYNCRIFGQFLYFFVPLKTGMSTLPSRHKQYNFNLTMSPLYLVKVKITQKQRTAYCSAFCWTDCSTFFHKVVQCSFFFLNLVQNSFSSLLAKNILHSHGVYPKNYLQTSWPATCHSYDVDKLLSK